MSYSRDCPIATQVSEATDLITSLDLRVRGLEDMLDDNTLPEEQRISIENELIEIKDILDKNKIVLKDLHKENTKIFMIAGCIFFSLFFVYAVYCIMYNKYNR